MPPSSTTETDDVDVIDPNSFRCAGCTHVRGACDMGHCAHASSNSRLLYAVRCRLWVVRTHRFGVRCYVIVNTTSLHYCPPRDVPTHARVPPSPDSTLDRDSVPVYTFVRRERDGIVDLKRGSCNERRLGALFSRRRLAMASAQVPLCQSGRGPTTCHWPRGCALHAGWTGRHHRRVKQQLVMMSSLPGWQSWRRRH